MARASKFLFAFLLCLCELHAQEVKQLPKHPGDVIKFEVTFQGVDADKITAVYTQLQSPAQPSPEQAGFTGNLNSSDFQRVSPGIFDIEVKVPDNALTGDYTLRLDVRSNSIQLNYFAGQQFQMRPVHIENLRKFVQPAVQVAQLP
jgi:hypothetical protein